MNNYPDDYRRWQDYPGSPLRMDDDEALEKIIDEKVQELLADPSALDDAIREATAADDDLLWTYTDAFSDLMTCRPHELEPIANRLRDIVENIAYAKVAKDVTGA